MRLTWRPIQKALLGGLGSRVALTLPTNAFGYDPGWTPYPYDPPAPARCWPRLGNPDGFTIPMVGRQGRYLKDREIMEATAGFLPPRRHQGGPALSRGRVCGEQVSEQKGREGIAFPGWSGRDPDLVWFPILRSGQYQSYYANPALRCAVGRGPRDAGRGAPSRRVPAGRGDHQGGRAAFAADQPPLIYGAAANLIWTPRTDSMIDLRQARYA